MNATEYLSRLAVALPLVLALIGGLWLAAKRGWIRPGMTSPAGSPLRPVATLSMGPGTRLVVVDFDGRRLLIASSRGGIVLLDDGRADDGRGR